VAKETQQAGQEACYIFVIRFREEAEGGNSINMLVDELKKHCRGDKFDQLFNAIDILR
jgi:hypothetical protein